MPRIKRWSPISHDFNRDPEVVEFRRMFGDWIGFAWQEMLHEADRNDGIVKGTVEQIAYRLAPISLKNYLKYPANQAQTFIKLAANLGWFQIHSDRIEIANHWKYHRTREPNHAPSEPNLTYPNLKSLKKDSRQQPKTAVDDPVLFEQEKTPKPELTVKDLVESWNEWFAGKLPTVELPLATSRHKRAAARLREHQNLDFWKKVFEQIGASAFLMGRNNGTWRCTFDFLVANDTNAIKIFEGSYNR